MMHRRERAARRHLHTRERRRGGRWRADILPHPVGDPCFIDDLLVDALGGWGRAEGGVEALGFVFQGLTDGFGRGGGVLVRVALVEFEEWGVDF